MMERKAKVLADIKERRQAKNQGEDEEWQDIDEHEREVFQTTGYFDVPEEENLISKHDQILLKQMEQPQSKQQEGGQTLADIIMQKLQTGDFVDGDAAPSLSEMKSTLDPKVVEAYKKVGIVMRSFKSGKLPKAFKIIP